MTWKTDIAALEKEIAAETGIPENELSRLCNFGFFMRFHRPPEEVILDKGWSSDSAFLKKEIYKSVFYAAVRINDMGK